MKGVEVLPEHSGEVGCRVLRGLLVGKISCSFGYALKHLHSTRIRIEVV